jgi:prepilin-type N-terminal cleavage/methylation domain-containing protein
MSTPRSLIVGGGFSLIELLVAMSVFSFMLLIVSTGFISIIKINQSTNSSRLTQQSARLIIDTLERKLRASSLAVVTPDSASSGMLGRLCLFDESQYIEYMVDTSGNLRQGTLASLGATCDAPTPAVLATWSTVNTNNVSSGATDGVKVRRFLPTATAVSGTNGGMVTVELSMTGQGVNDSSLNSTKTGCSPGPGSQFCSVTTLVTSAVLSGGTHL